MHHRTLLTWLAASRDPFHADAKTPGPNLTLLFDPESEYKGTVDRVVVLYNPGRGGANAERARRLMAEIERRGVPTELHEVQVNPIDHASIFREVRARVEEVRARFPGDEIVVHVSPGTPAMHTVWVLLAETGLIERPYRLVQSVSRADQAGGPPVVGVEIGLETPLKAFRAVEPAADSEVQAGPDPAGAMSPVLQDLYDRARVLARLRVPVLILGERGSGKTMLAAWIRANSPFRRAENDAAPPQVACGQFSPELVRSELFGHLKGSYTGATENRVGLLKRADGDTLFLDEIGDLTRDTQRLLIRAVETGEYAPHGADRVEQSRFRLVTATNVGWDTLGDRLDPDFLDRVSHFVLVAPPLRDIRADIPALWDRVVGRAAPEVGATAGALALVRARRADALAVLEGHPLPGNFRDLFRAAYHALAAAMEADGAGGAFGKGEARSAVNAALEARGTGGGKDPSRAILAACGRGEPLPWAALPDGRLSTRDVFASARLHLARDIRRESRVRGVPEEQICDVKPRTIQDWLAG